MLKILTLFHFDLFKEAEMIKMLHYNVKSSINVHYLILELFFFTLIQKEDESPAAFSLYLWQY